MLNNILNGYRPLITKLGVISLLAFCIAFALTPTNAKDTPVAPGQASPYFDLPTVLKCGPTNDFLEIVQGKAEEELIAVGNSDDDSQYVISIWTSPKTGTWTIALMDTKYPSITCIVHTGKNFKIKVPAQKGKYST